MEKFKRNQYFGMYEGQMVPLEQPMIEAPIVEEDQPALNKPKRGGSKKYYVYVKDPSTGNVKKVSFGDPSGELQSKINNPEARKSYAARHNCSAQKDKTKAGYWSCNLPRYAKSLGLKGGGNFFW
tara:strand:+ start:616 stop:990 length:375 start_codon:yes stop_codon:yes gene_type:complete